jgi:hypothetical protein
VARLAGRSLGRNAVASLVLVVLTIATVPACVRPDGFGAGSSPGPTTTIGAPSPGPSETEPGPSATSSAVPVQPSPADEPTRGPDEAVVEFTNPDGPDRADFAPDEYPFLETARTLETFGEIWLDQNQRDVHVALTGQIDEAIEVLREGIPRGITVYFHIVEYTQAELCALRDAMFAEWEELIEHGIVLMSGGCGNIRNRVIVGLSPLTPEVLDFMQARYAGPIDYEHAGHSALRPFDPPELDEVRLIALRESDDLGLLTCGRRPFPAAALDSAPAEIDGPASEYQALRESLAIYVPVYGDLTGLDWIIAEKDDYGATFLADRGDTWLEAPVFAGSGGWVPGTIDYCSPRPLSHTDGRSAAVTARSI